MNSTTIPSFRHGPAWCTPRTAPIPRFPLDPLARLHRYRWRLSALNAAAVVWASAGLAVLRAGDFTTDFEAGYLRGWTKTGTAFDHQPTLGDNATARGRGPANQQGDWWIGSYEHYQGYPGESPGTVQWDGPIGTLTSPPFLITGEEISFLIGGGNHPPGDRGGACTVTLEVDGVMQAYATGSNSEIMTRQAWNVSSLKGMTAVLKLTDAHTGDWGHLNCDDFQMIDPAGNRLPFAADRPVPRAPRLAVLTAPSGPDWSTTSTAFVTIGERNNPPLREPPTRMATSIAADDHAMLRITFSGEVEAIGGGRVIVRALVDGQPAVPSDVVFATGAFSGSRSFTFIKENLAAGGHGVEIQWKVDGGTTGFIGDATLAVLAVAPDDPNARMLVKAAPSGPTLSHTGNTWEALPELGGTLITPAAGNLSITISAEAYSDNHARLFLRALVDGQLAEPGDVWLATDWLGVSSFTFTRRNLPAGAHWLVLEWMTDANQTVHLADRTLAAVASPELTLHGGLLVNSPPPGPDVVTTNTAWEDVPGLTSYVATAANSHLEIAVAAETKTYGPHWIALRALIDGQPAEPSDVLFNAVNETGFSTRAFTFTKRQLGAGPHQVRLQWRTDASGVPALGDRTMTVSHWRADATDLSSTRFWMNPTIGTRKVLAILWDPARPEHPAPDRAAIETLLFGPKPSVAGYFRENSGGRCQLQSAGVRGWYPALNPASYYWGPEDPNDTNPRDGWIHPHVQKWAEAIRAADMDVDFSAYDTNRDGALTPEELAILIIIPQTNPFGTMNWAVGSEVPATDLVVDGVKISPISEAYVGNPPSLGLVAHELAHLLLNAGDMYFYFFQPYAAGPYSLMDSSPRNPGHLDPLHKLLAGWLDPSIVTTTGWHALRDIESSQDALLVYDPEHGADEYFLVENRWRGTSYDANLPSAGLAVWQIIEDPAVYGALPVPAGVDPGLWNDPAWTGWARRGIRMIRPIYGPPFNTALWDAATPQTGYDLLPDDPNPAHVELRWADGSPASFSLRFMPVAGPTAAVAVVFNNQPLPAPQLAIRRAGDFLQLAWPAGLHGFTLESSTGLAAPGWSPWQVSPVLIGDEKTVTFEPLEPSRFYRLRKP